MTKEQIILFVFAVIFTVLSVVSPILLPRLAGTPDGPKTPAENGENAIGATMWAFLVALAYAFALVILGCFLSLVFGLIGAILSLKLCAATKGAAKVVSIILAVINFVVISLAIIVFFIFSFGIA